MSVAERLAKVASKWSATLVHRGRKTGKPYEVTIWFMVEGETIWITTMNMGRQWTRNVQKNPDIELRIRGETFQGTISRITSDADMARVVELTKRKYWVTIPYFWVKGRPDGAFRVAITN